MSNVVPLADYTENFPSDDELHFLTDILYAQPATTEQLCWAAYGQMPDFKKHRSTYLWITGKYLFRLIPRYVVCDQTKTPFQYSLTAEGKDIHRLFTLDQPQ